MFKPITMLLGAALTLCGFTAHADEASRWREHEAPFTFLFGNDIDSHQETQQTRDGSLFGFLYVRLTGVVTKDRYPVATHVDCNTNPGCIVGWRLDGRPLRATFLYQPMHDHAVFLVNRPDIPQPGSHAHFHWLGSLMPQPHLPVEGYLLQLTAMSRFCFIHHDAQSATSEATCRDNGGTRVDSGVDIASHLNIVTSAPPGM
ncbi:MAG: hypothetical protein HY661_18400 [Betaproteobacteria bacterium]|nr:hypothetical protein [Betaproteobacteria bacterium]